MLHQLAPPNCCLNPLTTFYALLLTTPSMVRRQSDAAHPIPLIVDAVSKETHRNPLAFDRVDWTQVWQQISFDSCRMETNDCCILLSWIHLSQHTAPLKAAESYVVSIIINTYHDLQRRRGSLLSCLHNLLINPRQSNPTSPKNPPLIQFMASTFCGPRANWNKRTRCIKTIEVNDSIHRSIFNV